MNRSRVLALVISLSAAAFSASIAGCGGESGGEGPTGVGGASTGTGGTQTGGAGTTGGGGATSDAAHADAAGDAVKDVSPPDASQQDASPDHGAADAVAQLDSAPDAAPRVDAGPDASNRDAAGTDARDAGAPEIVTIEAAPPPPEAGPPEAGAPEAGPAEASLPEASPPEASLPEAATEAAPEEADATTDAVAAPEAGEQDVTAADAGGDIGVDPCDVSTEACIRSRDKSPNESPSMRCYQCMFDNQCFDPAMQGGICENVTGTAPASCGTVLGTSSAPSEAQVCLFTLKNEFASQCAVTLQQTPCLCGTADAAQCLTGNTPPLGPLFPVYQCDLGASAMTIQTNFTIPMFGAGQANALVQCAAAFNCDCF